MKKRKTKSKSAARKKKAVKPVRKAKSGKALKSKIVARRKKSAPKAKVKAKVKAKAKPSRRVIEPSSGSESSSLDPKRLGRLTVGRPDNLSPRGAQSGDDQGISRSERVDSESVEELLEEGNAFEAEVIEGVEDAPDADQGEVRTHEVPEDDVPSEYEDKDRL